ncbi:MAG: hypothetical protein IJI75_07100 [Solobacterium sp.]|nr:hypothetical protein [Solobacterium sp.]MCR5448809.1 hypothetical protein [Solobacterium sp.]MDO4193032.1 hypothetical protein [Erysipelotrichaceae bacterium]MDO5121553.1 hypothetical protein [Erysipelotrichaceae bacterium]
MKLSTIKKIFLVLAIINVVLFFMTGSAVFLFDGILFLVAPYILQWFRRNI